jgi:hypothetical protein
MNASFVRRSSERGCNKFESTDDTHVHPPGKFLVRVTIPEGYMSQAHKSEVHAMINQEFLEVLGGVTPRPAAEASW